MGGCTTPSPPDILYLSGFASPYGETTAALHADIRVGDNRELVELAGTLGVRFRSAPYALDQLPDREFEWPVAESDYSRGDRDLTLLFPLDQHSLNDMLRLWFEDENGNRYQMPAFADRQAVAEPAPRIS